MNKQKIVIIGGGTAGWITAAILCKKLPQARFDISLVESADVPSIGVGEATIPPILMLLEYLEIDEKSLLNKINGTYKYGIHFENWSQIGESYMHTFGEMGTDFDNTKFTELWLKNVEDYKLGPLNQYSPAGVAAYSGKFRPAQRIPDGANPKLYYPLSKLHYAYQFDAGLLVKFLKEFSVERGVTNTVANVMSVSSGGKHGYIQHLVLDDKTQIQGDFFVDCSGMKGLLNKQHFKCEFNDWSNFLPCDSAIAMQTVDHQPPFPYTKSVAMSAGWRWQIPLQNRLGNGYVYSSKHICDEEAIDELKSALSDHEIKTEPRVIKFKTGCLSQPWFKNSIAIGLSCGFFEPLESTSIYLIHKYAVQLKNSLLLGTNVEQEAEAFNRSFLKEGLEIRDFLVAHYCVTQREDTAFWRHCKTMDIPETVQNNLSQFKETGTISLNENHLFTIESWLLLLTGQRYLTDYSRFTDTTTNNRPTPQFFENVRGAIHSEVSKLTSHADYLAKSK